MSDVPKTVREADQKIARLGAHVYVRTTYPGAVQVWGNHREPFVPDDFDGVWRLDADRLLVVTALSGEYGRPVRQFRPRMQVTAGTRDYVRHAAEQLREHDQVDLGDEIERQMYDDRLWHYEISTDPDRDDITSRQYDISDARLLGAILDAVHALDLNAVEALRARFGDGLQRSLADAYDTLETWPQRAYLVRALNGNHGPALAPVFEAVLGIPDGAGGDTDADMVREVRAIALADLEAGGDFDRFMRYYQDDAAAVAAIRQRAG